MDDFANVEIKPKLIKDIVYETLKKAIINGQLKPGQRLVEAKLSKEFNISRSPLREALMKLKFDGLVTKDRNGRVSVSILTEKEAREIYKIRSLIEAKIIEEVTLNWEGDDLKKLEQLISKIEEIINKGERLTEEEIEDLKDLNISFHIELLKVYGNGTYQEIFERFQDRINRYSYQTIKSPNRYIEASKEHILLFRLIKDREDKKAKRAIIKHINTAKKMLLQQLKQNN